MDWKILGNHKPPTGGIGSLFIRAGGGKRVRTQVTISTAAYKALGVPAYVTVMQSEARWRIAPAQANEFGARLLCAPKGASFYTISCTELGHALPNGERVPVEVVDGGLEFETEGPK